MMTVLSGAPRPRIAMTAYQFAARCTACGRPQRDGTTRGGGLIPVKSHSTNTPSRNGSGFTSLESPQRMVAPFRMGTVHAWVDAKDGTTIVDSDRSSAPVSVAPSEDRMLSRSSFAVADAECVVKVTMTPLTT